MPLNREIMTQVTALDSIIGANLLFAVGVFFGLALSPNAAVAALYLYSLISYIVAFVAGLAIKLGFRYNPAEPLVARVDRTLYRAGLLVSGFGTVFGTILMTLGLAGVVQIRLGPIAGGNVNSVVVAVGTLAILVPTGLLFYVAALFCAMFW